MQILDTLILGNSVASWLKAIIAFVSFSLIFRIAKAILIKEASKIVDKSRNKLDNLFLRIVEQTKNFVILLAGLFVGSQFLTIPAKWEKVINKTFYVVAALQIGFWLGGFINHLITLREIHDKDNKKEQTAVRAFGLFGKILIWIIIAMVTVQNITGIKMDALLTSLGIGGIAAGLAVQNILKDLFASLSIFMDKPFLVGDYITVNDVGGTVENIGLKSTRLRTIVGEELIFSNSNLLDSQIHNYRTMKRRMVVISIGVSPDTPYETLRKLPGLFKEIIEKEESVTFDRANLTDLGQYTVDFEIVYHIESPDYNFFMNKKEAIYLEIIRQLQKNKVSMPYPTQTVLLNQ